MGNAASKLGWLIFFAALAGAALHTGPDDPLTAGLKSTGAYGRLLVVASLLLGFLLVWLALAMRKTVAMRRHLNHLKNRKGG